MKNIIVFIEPNEHSYNTNWKIANLYLNRLTIDEDAAFELLGVYYLKENHDDFQEVPDELRVQRKEKVTVMNSKFEFRINYLFGAHNFRNENVPSSRF